MALIVDAGRRTAPAILALLVLVFLKGLLFAAMLPAWEGDDETAYWTDIRSIAEPARVANAGTAHGRVYPIIAAPIYRATRSLSPAHRLFAVRLLGIILHAAIVYLAWLLARLLWPDSTFIQLAGPLVVAFNPKLAFVMAAVNTDVFLIFIFSLFLVQLTSFVLKPSGVKAALLGPVVIVGALTKNRFYIAFPVLALAALALGLEGLIRTRLYKANRQLFWGAGAALLIGVWDFWPKIEGLLGQGPGKVALAAFTFDRTLLGIWAQPWFRFRMFRQFWGFFAWHGGIYLSEPVYTVLTALSAVAAGGLMLRFYRALRSVVALDSSREKTAGGGLALSIKSITLAQYRQALAVALNLTTVWLVIVATGAYELSGSAALGRYLLVAAVPPAVLGAAGVEVFLPDRFRRWGLVALAAGGFWLNIVAITAFLMPRFY